MASSPRTYHCLCTTLIVATNYNLDSLPVRAAPSLDQAKILPVENESQDDSHTKLHNIVSDRKAIIVRREDGFEKRLLLRCQRCNLVLAFQLGGAQVDEGTESNRIVYLLPGALVSTDDMKAAKMPATPEWARQRA